MQPIGIFNFRAEKRLNMVSSELTVNRIFPEAARAEMRQKGGMHGCPIKLRLA